MGDITVYYMNIGSKMYTYILGITMRRIKIIIDSVAPNFRSSNTQDSCFAGMNKQNVSTTSRAENNKLRARKKQIVRIF